MEPVEKEIEQVNEQTNEQVNEQTNQQEQEEQAKKLMRQTSYTLEECTEMLKSKTIEECIKDFLGIVEKKEETGSTNQKIFRSIRERF